MRYTERCEGIKASGERCKCYGVMQVNSLWYCKVHGEKELSAVAIQKPASLGEKRRGEKGGVGG